MITHPDTRLLSSRKRPSLRDLLCDHRILSECHGEAIIAGDRAQIDRLNVLLDAIEAEIRQRPESEWSAYDAQRWLKGIEKGR